MDPQERLSLEQELLEILKRRQGIEKDTLEDARDFANVLQSQTKEIKEQIIQRNKIRSLSRDVIKQAEQLYSITKDELGTTKNLTDLAKKRQDLEKTQIQLSSFLNTIKTGNAQIDADINHSIQEQIINTQKLLKETKELETTSNKIANNFGVKTFGALSDITKKIPGLSRFSEPFNDAAEAARKTSQQNIGIEKFKQLRKEGVGIREALDKAGVSAQQVKLGSTSPFLAGVKSLGPAIAKAFGPAAIIYELVQAFIKLDNLAGDTAKSMGISYSEATQLNTRFNEMANSSNNIFVTTKGINESFNQINSALGTNADLSEELLVTQTELTKQAFYSVEAATEISKLSLATGKPAKEIVTSFLGQAKALNLVNNTAINGKTLLESISKTSKGILATFAAQPNKLAEAAFAAKKVGLELNEIKGIQDSLLNIESSIAAEFEAEVITGKQMNLERARYYALTNNIAGLSQELTKQNITQASFAGMNVLQQESVAQAMGLSRDQLGGMLLEQAALSKLTKGDAEENRKKLALLKEQGFSTQAIAELGQEEFDRQLASASMQDKFNASVEKLKEIFVGVMASLMPIFDVFSEIFKIIGPIVNIIMKGLLPSLHLISGVLTGILEIFKFVFTLGKSGFEGSKASFSNFGKSLSNTVQADILNATTGINISQNPQTVQDGMASSSKGPFTITDRYGATAITSVGDGIAVSPNIRTQSVPPTQTTSPTAIIDYEKLGTHLAQAVSKVTVQTNLDGVNVSRGLQTPLGIATRKI